MSREWVDFKAVKTAVSMQMVLDRYGIQGLTKTGDELRGPCPLHKGSARKKNFSVNLTKNAFKCFSSDCKAKGNVLDFVAAIERCDIRQAALKLAEWFGVGQSESAKAVTEPKSEGEVETINVRRGIYRNDDDELYEVVIPLALAEDGEHVVVYREMFGDYRYCVGGLENFTHVEDSPIEALTLVKTL